MKINVAPWVAHPPVSSQSPSARCSARIEAMPANLEAAALAKYTCPKASTDADKLRVAQGLSVKTNDKNALACAADLRAAASMASPTDRGVRVAALQSLATYIDMVRELKRFDLVRVNWAEYELRLEHAKKLADDLLPPTRQRWPDDPSAMILDARIRSSLAGPNDFLAMATLAAIEELKKAAAADPKALDGEGELLTGRLYMDLPPLFGGSTKEALPHLQRARDVDPQNPLAQRYLTEAYDEVGDRESAMAALHALGVTPRDSDLQLYADEWRYGEGLASRMGDTGLADKFATLRADLMRQHPNLLLRKVAAVFGHGGDDPMTGTPQYRGEHTNTH